MRNTETVIKDVKNLINSKGYIYALCMILFEDFHIDPEKIQEIDYRERISTKEASLLLGFLIQNEINFTAPDSWQDLIKMKHKTYELMEELQKSFMIPFFGKLQGSLEKEHKKENFRKEQKEFFGKGDMLIEPIFYSGTGCYDFQYLDYLERKYKYDKVWLSEKKNFDLDQTKYVVTQIKNILYEKSKKVHLYHLKEQLPQMINDFKKKNPKEDWEKHAKEVLPMMELYQYEELFEDAPNKEKLSTSEIMEYRWTSFYNGLIEEFVIRKSDFDSDVDIDSFLMNFSISFQKNLNSQFQTIGNYNLINSHPIIKLDEERYFIPITFLLFKTIYESPFYWMINDKEYNARASNNRGKVGEEIAYEFLLKVFGKHRTFKSLTITTTKGKDDTDIDVLCILGNKALCVQVKSKKLTELSRMGNDEQLKKDFQGAVQDAYEQGLVSRRKILAKNAKFRDENGNEIKLSEEIDDVYIMGVTTENYPFLTHQAHIMLDKKDADPCPIILTIFDLELLTHYLNDPFDFLYYIRQRIMLMDYFKAEEEMAFLGYHLSKKLWKLPNNDMVMINSDIAQLIDRNYYPLKAGLKVSDDGDVIKNRWKNDNFDQLCNQLKNLDQEKITDIIFQLLDLSGETIDIFVDSMRKTKQKTLDDGKYHNFSMPPKDRFSPRLGLTYFVLNTNDIDDLASRLLTLCIARKYKHKSDIWIGFGSLKNSPLMIDSVTFNDDPWQYDEELEKLVKLILKDNGQRQYIKLTK